MSSADRRVRLDEHLSNIDEELDRLDQEDRAHRQRLHIENFDDIDHPEPVDWAVFGYMTAFFIGGGIVILSLILHAIDLARWVYHIVAG